LDLRKVLLEMAPTTFNAAIEIAIRIEGENIEYAKTKENERYRSSLHRKGLGNLNGRKIKSQDKKSL
jgi:hypothetical protein